MGLTADPIEQEIEADVHRQARDAEGKAQPHQDHQQHGDAVHRPGGVPHQHGEDQGEQHGSPVAAHPRHAIYDETGRGDVGVEQYAADEIDAEVVEGIDLLPQQIPGHGIEGDAQRIALVGFEQHPARDRHHHHGQRHREHGPEAPGTRARTRQSQHTGSHTDAGNDACPAHQRWFLFHYSPKRIVDWSRRAAVLLLRSPMLAPGDFTLHAFGYQIRGRIDGKWGRYPAISTKFWAVQAPDTTGGARRRPLSACRRVEVNRYRWATCPPWPSGGRWPSAPRTG
ncbi:hypothetical protein D3C78_983550 [compost metagenome]